MTLPNRWIGVGARAAWSTLEVEPFVGEAGEAGGVAGEDGYRAGAVAGVPVLDEDQCGGQACGEVHSLVVQVDRQVYVGFLRVR